MILNKITIKNDYIQNLICFLALRLFTMIKTKRSRIKNGDLLYTYYVSFIFQIIILPLLTAKYYLYNNNYSTIIFSAINYFISDIPELIYSKSYKYLIHHSISIFLLYFSKQLPQPTHLHAVTNLFLLELGSSILSLPVIFKNNYLYKTRPYVFSLSRILAIINTYFLIKNPILDTKVKYVLSILSTFLIADNAILLKQLYYKNKKYRQN